MPNKNYVSGRNLEYRIKHYLESKGYTVIRSAGSHTEIDIVALKAPHGIDTLPSSEFPPLLIIQAKGGILYPKEKRRLEVRLMRYEGIYAAKAFVLGKDFKKAL